MYMKYIIVLIITVNTFLACNSKQSEIQNSDSGKIQAKAIPVLYIQTITAVGTGDKQKMTKAITIINSDYFEVSLNSFGNVNPNQAGDSGFRAGKEIESPKIDVEFRSVFFDVTDKDGTILEFKTSTQFLNFMSERGYEMVDQIKSKYHTDYTFKKK